MPVSGLGEELLLYYKEITSNHFIDFTDFSCRIFCHATGGKEPTMVRLSRGSTQHIEYVGLNTWARPLNLQLNG